MITFWLVMVVMVGAFIAGVGVGRLGRDQPAPETTETVIHAPMSRKLDPDVW